MNHDQSLIASVIVLPYNDKQYLDACLSSLLDQEMLENDFKTIYANNSSTDDSADFVAEHFPTVRVLRFEENYGFAKGNNRTAEAATGRYITI
jgi:GT2 family glycosyltransferase